jgi:uncharacterized protein (TIGR02996 family)
MTDLDALRLAVLTAPDDDLPRLVYADCLEENGDPDRAAFIRAQIELAKQPEYEPFPVYCKTRRPEWVTGEPWQTNLVPFPPGVALEWPAEAFHRGFGWAVRVHFISVALDGVSALFGREPVGELYLGTSTLDEWKQLADSVWLPRIRSFTIGGLSSPNEPLRVLRHSPFTSGIRSLRLEHTNVPSLAVILEELFAAPLGRQLTALSMRLGYGSADEWVEAVADSGGCNVTEYNLERMGFGPASMRLLVDSGMANRTEVLRLVGNPVMNSGVEILATATDQLRVLDLRETHLDEEAVEAIANSGGFRSLRKLVLEGNPFRNNAIKSIARSPHLAGLRSLDLAITRTDNAAVRYLTRGTFWPNLVELDLTGNPISDAGAKHLMTARPAPELTSLRLPGRNLSEGMKADLREKFGEAVGFTE